MDALPVDVAPHVDTGMTFREIQERAAERAREGRRIINGRMFTGTLICTCGEIVSERFLPRHVELNHQRRSAA